MNVDLVVGVGTAARAAATGAGGEASALEAAYGDMQTSIRNSPLGYSCAAFLRPPPCPLVVAGPLGSRRERTFERFSPIGQAHS